MLDPFLFASAADAMEFQDGLTGVLLNLGVIMSVDFFKLFRVDEKGEMLPYQLFGRIPGEGMDPCAGKFDEPPDVGGVDDTGEVIDEFPVIGLG